MTTGQIDPLEFISLRPDENTRSIVEIAEEIKKNGYSNLTDTEIQLHIEYEKKVALQKQENEFRMKEQDAQLDRLKSIIDELNANR